MGQTLRLKGGGGSCLNVDHNFLDLFVYNLQCFFDEIVSHLSYNHLHHILSFYGRI